VSLPTRLEIFHGEKRIELLDYRGLPVAHIYGNGTANGARYKQDAEANARLLAAAPDLLAAGTAFLKFFDRVSLIEVSSDMAEALSNLREAVAHAEGHASWTASWVHPTPGGAA
jgi:hypothetical protein